MFLPEVGGVTSSDPHAWESGAFYRGYVMVREPTVLSYSRREFFLITGTIRPGPHARLFKMTFDDAIDVGPVGQVMQDRAKVRLMSGANAQALILLCPDPAP